jgi:hypothetical protein
MITRWRWIGSHQRLRHSSRLELTLTRFGHTTSLALPGSLMTTVIHLLP